MTLYSEINNIWKAEMTPKGAEDFFKFCQDNLTKEDNCVFHNKRQFIFLAKGTIDHVRTERIEKTSYLKGTQQQHSIRGDTPYNISFRERSCFCSSCVTANGECSNKDFVGEWQKSCLKANYVGKNIWIY